MCDYSLHGLPNRLAEQDEVLVVHRFYTGSKGLTSPEYLKPAEPPKKGLLSMLAQFWRFPAQPKVCAVCIPDGARLMLQEIAPSLRRAHGLSATESVTFRQLSAEAHTYRDAVEFKNGLKLRLQDLEEGQSVEVLALFREDRCSGGVHSKQTLSTATQKTIEPRAAVLAAVGHCRNEQPIEPLAPGTPHVRG